MLKKDKALLESLTKKYGKKNLLNEMSIESFNTRVAKDFVAMVLQYVNDEPDIVVNYNEFNYGEYESWAKAYPELANLCMVGGNNISDVADELVDALFNFIRVAQRNTITSTYRRELENKDVEENTEMSQQEFNKMFNKAITMWDGNIYNRLNKLSNNEKEMNKIFNMVKKESYRYNIDYYDSLVSLIKHGKI